MNKSLTSFIIALTLCILSIAPVAAEEALTLIGNKGEYCEVKTITERFQKGEEIDHSQDPTILKDHSSWTLDIKALPKHLQELLDRPDLITIEKLDEIGIEVLKQNPPSSHQYIATVFERIKTYAAYNRPYHTHSSSRFRKGNPH